MSIVGDSVSVFTNDPQYINTYVVTITISLQDYPAIPSVTKTFNVIINCSVATLTFAAPLIPALTLV
jgi:hypothetical protein